MNVAQIARGLGLGAVVLAGSVGCAPADLYYGVGVTDAYTDYGYSYYPTPYADWFAYGPAYRGPYYHPYPNVEYFVEYRPVYPG